MAKENSILFVEHSPDMGGGQTVLLTLLDAALEIFDKVTVLAPMGGTLEIAIKTRYSDRVGFRNVVEPKLTHGRKSWRDVGLLFFYTLSFIKYHNLFRQNVLIYVNGSRYFPASCLLSLLSWRRCCYHIHLVHGQRELLLLNFIARIPTTAIMVVSSPFILRAMTKTHARLSSNPKITVLENGLTDSFDGLPFLDRFSASLENLSAMVLGVLRPEKGQDAAISVATNCPNLATIFIGRIGSGAEEWVKTLKTTAPANVNFYGETSDVIGTIDRLGVALNLVPSYQESFGLAALEGMACSCLTLVRNVGGLVDIAASTGAVTFESNQDLVDIVKEILRTPRHRLAERARSQYRSTIAVYGAAKFRTRATELLRSLLT